MGLRLFIFVMNQPPSKRFRGLWRLQGGVGLVATDESWQSSIVFVHGFRGDRRRTWATRQLKESKPFWKSIKSGGKRRESDETAPGGDVFWPRDLLPVDVPNIRVFTFGYDASIATVMSRSANNSIFSAAQDLIARLAAARESLRGVRSHAPNCNLDTNAWNSSGLYSHHFRRAFSGRNCGERC